VEGLIFLVITTKIHGKKVAPKFFSWHLDSNEICHALLKTSDFAVSGSYNSKW